MKKNILIVLFLLLAGAGAAGTLYFYRQYGEVAATRDQLIRQNGELQVAIDAIGPITEVYTVSTDVHAGMEVQLEELVMQTIPVSSVTDNYCLDANEIVGRYWKIDLSPGVSITKDCLMSDPMEDIMYERDITFSYLPLGIKVGDYIDVRMVLPYGQEFIILSHQRVRQLVEQTNTIKLVLTEAQNTVWNSALKDKALYGGKGLSIYVTKYIEPGITDVANTYYPVRKEMEAVVNLNPNIKDKSLCINSQLREDIDYLLTQIDELEVSDLVNGVATEASGINSSKSNYWEESPTYQGDVSLKEQMEQGYDTIINLNPEDINGNSSSVTDEQKGNAKGDNPYSGEDPIE